MDDIWQWVAVALAVAAAAAYLIKRLTASKDGCGCGQCGDSCPLDYEAAKREGNEECGRHSGE